MELTTCSPVFIGSGDEISSGEFLKDNHSIYIPNNNDLAQIITSDNALFVNYKDVLSKLALNKTDNQSKNSQLDLSSVFFKHPSQKEKLKKISKQISINQRLQQDHLTNPINLFINNSDGFYIPGSSIKGAFRTYMLKHLIARNKSLDSNKASDIENEYLRSGDKKATDDFLRSWQFADSGTIDNKNFEVYKINKLGLKKGSIPIYIIGLKTNVKIEFDLTFDAFIAHDLGSKLPTIDELPELFKKIADKEIKDLKQKHHTETELIPPNSTNINFSLGGHIGKLRHTLADKTPKTISTINGVSLGWCHLQILDKQEF